MPNHITNRLTIIPNETNVTLFTGEDVLRVREAIKGEREDQYIDFHKIAPIPKELEGTVSPMRIISQEEYDSQELKIATNDLTENEKNWGISRGLTQALADEYKKKFGHCDWYGWQTANWGTKWNAYEQVEHDANVIEFDTAWSTPYSLLVNLSKMFPQVTFEVEYADEDFGYNVGRYVLLNGETIEENIPDGGSQEALEMAMDIKGDEEYYLESYLIDEADEDGELSDFAETLIQIAHERGKLVEDYPVIVLDKLKELALADEQFERVVEIDKLLTKANSTDDEDYQSGLLYGVDNNQ
jgi:hypothetical protein